MAPPVIAPANTGQNTASRALRRRWCRIRPDRSLRTSAPTFREIASQTIRGLAIRGQSQRVKTFGIVSLTKREKRKETAGYADNPRKYGSRGHFDGSGLGGPIQVGQANQRIQNVAFGIRNKARFMVKSPTPRIILDLALTDDNGGGRPSVSTSRRKVVTSNAEYRRNQGSWP